MRVWPAPDSTRVVFDLSGPLTHKTFTMKSPDRIVIDLKQSRIKPSVSLKQDKAGVVVRVRTATRNGKDLRIVLDMGVKTDINSFLLEPNKAYGHRLVVDLKHQVNIAKKITPPITRQNIAPKPNRARDIIIAIDAGHGGEDPGAKGPHGVYEKDVVLSVARALKKQIDQQRGMQAVLIRNGDYFLELRNRIEKARQKKADLFISIHADAFKDRRVQGSSVYVLSQRGASSEAARWLAESENAADLVGGVSLNDKDDLLRSVLLDLSQTATIEASTTVADKVLSGLKGIGKVHKKQVQHAGFVVLKSPDIPSILVETAFISNPSEERKLQDKRHQMKLAKAITSGVRTYFKRYAPPGTVLASRQHRVAQGETLSGIANRYRVSTANLKSENRLQNDLVQVGSVLRIPWSDS